MQYIVDGYNLLFHSAWNRSDISFQSGRQHLIEELDRISSICNLTIRLVFDATQRSGEEVRGNYHTIEIVYTAAGTTADCYLVDMAEWHPKLNLLQFVTSDKQLKDRLRQRGANTMPIDEFLKLLRKRMKKKLSPKTPSPSPIPSQAPAPKRSASHTQRIEKIPATAVQEKPSAAVTKKNALPELTDYESWKRIFNALLEERESESR